MDDQPKNPTVSLMLSFTICYMVSFVGAQGTFQGLGTWWVTINRPTWSPPDSWFMPVWTVLYACMAYAAWSVWRADIEGRKRRMALALFGIQLFLNGLWPWLFFALQKLLLATVEIGLLWIFILWTTISFYKISKKAGWLMVPYLAWVSFAMALSFSIWRLNP